MWGQAAYDPYGYYLNLATVQMPISRCIPLHVYVSALHLSLSQPPSLPPSLSQQHEVWSDFLETDWSGVNWGAAAEVNDINSAVMRPGGVNYGAPPPRPSHYYAGPPRATSPTPSFYAGTSPQAAEPIAVQVFSFCFVSFPILLRVTVIPIIMSESVS